MLSSRSAAAELHPHADPAELDDAAHYAKLRDFRLKPETRIYLGLVHMTDGVAGAKQRINAARVCRISASASCGLGRRTAANSAILFASRVAAIAWCGAAPPPNQRNDIGRIAMSFGIDSRRALGCLLAFGSLAWRRNSHRLHGDADRRRRRDRPARRQRLEDRPRARGWTGGDKIAGVPLRVFYADDQLARRGAQGDQRLISQEHPGAGFMWTNILLAARRR